ncbi:helix-turn-helix domain-containing protein [Escherichia sp. E1130]|nr:helix-turn-helix domain-containing protein [Escherichia sp. E1130]
MAIPAKKAAEILDVSTRTIYQLINSGQLAGKKIGNKYRTTASACLAYLYSPQETKQANAGDHKGDNLCQSPSEAVCGTVISLRRQEKELDALLVRGTKSKRRNCTTN